MRGTLDQLQRHVRRGGPAGWPGGAGDSAELHADVEGDQIVVSLDRHGERVVLGVLDGRPDVM